MSVLEFRPEGIYCSQGDFYIDPWRPVDKALITHGHADHARFGSKKYLCTDIAAPVIRHRLGNVAIETIPYEKELSLNGVNVSFYPAGHVPGSAQILIEIKGERWVVSGDYKVVDDGLSTPFKPIKCHSFISECTFGLPAFNWLPQEQVFKEINSWWHQCISDGLTPILAAYGLGKAQRLIAGLDTNIGPILTHGAIEKTNQIMRDQKIAIPETFLVTSKLDLANFKNAIVLAPPSALSTSWVKKFGKISKTYKNGKTVEIQDNRKKWSVRISNDILQLRKDENSLEIINDTKKRDDMCDCLLMTITFSYLYFVNKTKFSY